MLAACSGIDGEIAGHVHPIERQLQPGHRHIRRRRTLAEICVAPRASPGGNAWPVQAARSRRERGVEFQCALAGTVRCQRAVEARIDEIGGQGQFARLPSAITAAGLSSDLRRSAAGYYR